MVKKPRHAIAPHATDMAICYTCFAAAIAFTIIRCIASTPTMPAPPQFRPYRLSPGFRLAIPALPQLPVEPEVPAGARGAGGGRVRADSDNRVQWIGAGVLAARVCSFTSASPPGTGRARAGQRQLSARALTLAQSATGVPSASGCCDVASAFAARRPALDEHRLLFASFFAPPTFSPCCSAPPGQ